MADHAHNLRAQFNVTAGKPVGVITRGTTNTNRLRRCDRWMRTDPAVIAALRSAGTDRPLAVDVGYGASYATTCEWKRMLDSSPHRCPTGRRFDVEVVGLEIDPARVLPPRDGVRFELGGFELAGYQPQLVRAFNVLRQYDVAQVDAAWQTVCSRLAPGGVFVEGTCDELGRRMAWVLLGAEGPRSLTLAWDPWDVRRPSELAERLPKALIHRNVEGDTVRELLDEADAAWDRAAPFAAFGPRVRWFEARKSLRWPHTPQRRLLRDNWLTVPWSF